LKLVSEIDHKLQEDGSAVVYHNRNASCRRPQVKGSVQQANSIYNNWRMEDVRIDT
jgi:hypothetical protein